MRHAVTDLGAFGIVEPVHRTDEIPRDAPDALKLHSISHLAVNDGQVVELTHGGACSWLLLPSYFSRVVRQPRPCPASFVVRFGVRFRLGGKRHLNLHRLRVLVHGLVDDLLDALHERAGFFRVPLNQLNHVERLRLEFRFQASGQGHGAGGKFLIDGIPRNELSLFDLEVELFTVGGVLDASD